MCVCVYINIYICKHICLPNYYSLINTVAVVVVVLFLF